VTLTQKLLTQNILRILDYLEEYFFNANECQDEKKDLKIKIKNPTQAPSLALSATL
jgi:hypothetical protein